MNIISKHMIKAFFVFTVLWSSLSCSSDINESVAPSDVVELSIGFRMATRAPEGPYEEGETYENYIDVATGNYRIYFFDADDNFIARFQPSGFLATQGSNYRKYTVTGKAPNSLVNKKDFKVVVIANWPTYPDDSEITTIENLCNHDKSRFTLSTSSSLDAHSLIPFYGVREFREITFEPDVTTILPDPITLLRAVAKVEVILQSEAEHNLSFSSVQVCRYNRQGYCAPNANMRNNYDHDGNWDYDYAESLHLVDNRNDVDVNNLVEEKRLSFHRVDSWADNTGNKFEKWIVYLTEYQNIGVEEGYCFIEAKFTHQLEGDNPHKIYFAQYTNGQTDNTDRLNVERNNLYRFQVAATPLQLLVSVEEWVYGGTVHIEI